ncbi:hypothetical protein CN429_05285 [Bacillus cereus]|nr:hypothetical protein CN429_05285 [Bacillus cereus]
MWTCPKNRYTPIIWFFPLLKLPRFHAIISVRAGGDLQHVFICKMKPPVEQKYSNSYLTKQHTQLYGRSWEELQG